MEIRDMNKILSQLLVLLFLNGMFLIPASAATQDQLFPLIQEAIQLQIDAELAPLRELPDALKREVEVAKNNDSPKPNEIIRGEFESTSRFKQRIAEEEERYQSAIGAYNLVLKDVHNKVAHFYKNAPTSLSKVRENGIIRDTLQWMLGTFEIDKVTYEPDSQIFMMNLSSINPLNIDYKLPVAMVEEIPNNQARAFKQQLQSGLTPLISYSLHNGHIAWKGAKIVIDNRAYSLQQIDEEYQTLLTTNQQSYTPQALQQKINAVIDVDALKSSQLSTAQGVDISIEVSEELIAERKKVAKLKKRRELQKAQQEEMARARAERERLESSMYAYNDDLKPLLDRLPQQEQDPNKHVIAIAIKEYFDSPPVTFADRSGKLFVNTMKRLGVPEQNITQLVDNHATGTRIYNNIKRKLKQLGPEDTLYFYYAGHGVPDRNNNQYTYLLPVDGEMSSAEDERLEMGKLYNMMAQSNAKHITAFVDACFSGQAERGKMVFEGIAGIKMQRRININEERLTLFSAGKNDQYANQYKAKGHRLFSYYLIRGLLEGKRDLTSLKEYVATQVLTDSRRMAGADEQTPEVIGSLDRNI
jgi:hypothetical protein